ncbi:pyridoxamine 5'-phosphate oxidase family protein [Streptomyces sp. NPDC056121]|uniref:pyridoxamine 5'-phosphate oxidase family protein n=1 Tax=Streptomyces sp. NPDC056121 TaxID=3345718 RepID=UPI0035D607EC
MCGLAQGPAPRPLLDETLSVLLGKRGFGVLLTVRRSCCHPHLATVLYRWDSGARMVWFSAAADRIKVGHLCRCPRVMVHVGGDGVRGLHRRLHL